MREYLKWLFAKREMQELYRWRREWEVYRRWLAMYQVDQTNVRFIEEVRKDIDELRNMTPGPKPSRSQDAYTRKFLDGEA
jgi:hypothetical protein